MEDIKRIEGFALTAGSTAVLIHNTDYDGSGMSPATLFISKDDKPPKVFTEEEVRNMLHRVKAANRHGFSLEQLIEINRCGITL